MNVLIVKTSSLGDVLHTLPAVSDAMRWDPTLAFHWLVEEHFAEIPQWHPAVQRVIVLPWRRLRKKLLRNTFQGEWRKVLRELRRDPYDAIIDAQGLWKSAIPARLARGEVWGMDAQSAREATASWCYHHRVTIAKEQHAVTRIRALFARVLHYPLPSEPADYGLANRFPAPAQRNHLVFIHGTTWSSKHWPVPFWSELIRNVSQHTPIVLPWGSPAEKERADMLARIAPGSIRVPGKTRLEQLAEVIAGARAVVSVDTGPAHLAAALNVPALCLYGPTDPARVGTLCQHHQHIRGACVQSPCKQRICPLVAPPLAAPCMESITPEHIITWLQSLP
ncbi:MAG: lipopolysaccharide heptosyltransferase I [Magnetococcales bacterium]|nr:lipopolysaccharide heptosyltransferase I [Magnetococcales bacterium]